MKNLRWFQILLIVVLAISIVAAAGGLNLTRLRTKNKSGVPVYVSLDPIPTKDFPGMWYYFELEAGTKYDPFEKTFTVMPGKYSLYLKAGDPAMPVTNPFCLSVKDNDKMTAGIQIEFNKSQMTMLFTDCISVQNFPNEYNKETGFWKDFDTLWRMVYQYRPGKLIDASP